MRHFLSQDLIDSLPNTAAANQQIVARDTDLPGLKHLLAPDDLHRPLTNLLQTLDLRQIERTYLRYKPHRRCVAILEVTTDYGQELVTATAMTPDSWSRWKQKTRDDPATGLVHAVDEHRVRLERFPQDRQLRQVAKLYDPEYAPKMIRHILPQEKSFRKLPADQILLDRLAYKPARRLVVSLSPANAALNDDHSKYTVKCHSTATFAAIAERIHAARLLQIPHASLASVSERYFVTTSKWVTGNNLTTLLSEESSTLNADILRQVGTQLADLHNCPIPHHIGLPQLHKDSVQLELQRLGETLKFLCPALASHLELVISQVSALLPDNAQDTLIHGDFYARQVIVNSSTISFIDLDELSVGSRWYDVGNFVAKLHWHQVRGQLTPHRMEWAVEHFLDGYRERTTWNEAGFRASLALGLLRSMPHTFRQAGHHWPQLLTRLLQRVATACPPPATQTPADSFLQPDFTSDEAATATVNAGLQLPSTELQPSLDKMQFNDARVVRLKENRRCLLECTFHDINSSSDAARNSKHIVLGKVRFKGLDRRTPQLHRHLQQAGFDHTSSTRVPRLLGTVPALNMWLQEKITAAAVTPDIRTPMRVHARVAQSLASLHQSGIASDRTHNAEDEWQQLEHRLLALADQRAELQTQISDVLRKCRMLIDSLTQNCLGLLHRDFYFDQVLFTEQQITLIDLDLAAIGPVELDAGNYLAHLIEYGIRTPQAADYCRDAAAEFEQSFLAVSPAALPEAVHSWTVLSLARHIGISTHFPERSHTTQLLLNTLLSQKVI